MTQTPLTTAQEAVRLAHEALSDIIGKCAKHEERLANIGRLRAESAYDAHRGDPKARRTLDQLHLQAAKAESEGTSYEAAIEEAQHRVQVAETALEKVRSTQNAAAALDRLGSLRLAGARFDEAVGHLIKAHSALLDETRAIRQLGCQAPTEITVRNSLRRSLLSALVGSHLQTELIPFGERWTAAQNCDRWARGVEGWAGKFDDDDATAPPPPDEREDALPKIREHLATPHRPPPDRAGHLSRLRAEANLVHGEHRRRLEAEVARLEAEEAALHNQRTEEAA